MDKNAIKKYAVWARTELITRVSQQAEKYDITAEADASASSVNGVLLSDAEKKQRKALIEQVKQKGFDQVMEEVAYTWFNRFIALRFMEVNGYLPSHIRVFTDDNNDFKPQILSEAIHLDLEGLDMERVYEMKNSNENDELYKYLIITQCNELSKILPGMFQKISDYTELLFPNNILRENSAIEQMVALIPEDDWKDQVQILGWLYQYYNSEPKDRVFAALKKNVKISKDNIPAATQLFTPDWIVRYMVENSLGRLWVEGHTDSSIKGEWKYYIEDNFQELTVEKTIESIKKKYADIKPEEIRCIDPCSGSGHILAYMYDVLVQIYEDYGVSTRDAVRNIINNNIWGLDIDNRAAQLAYFSVMMKSAQYDRRFLNRKNEDGMPDVPQPHIYAIIESNNIDKDAVDYFCGDDSSLKADVETIIKTLLDAKEYGSMLSIPSVNYQHIFCRFNEVENEISIYKGYVLNNLKSIVDIAFALSQKYNVVVTNPPYMGSSSMDTKLTKFAKKYYKDEKSDLFAMFINRCMDLTEKDGFQAMITQHAMMFLVSYEELRKKLQKRNLVNLVHLGAHAFDEIGGEVVQSVSFVYRNSTIEDAESMFIRLTQFNGEQEKSNHFRDSENQYVRKVKDFVKISGEPYAYWLSTREIEAFDNPTIGTSMKARQGMSTTANDTYVRKWYEIDFNRISFDGDVNNFEWFLYNKSGEYRRWYGNLYHIVHYENNGQVLLDMVRAKYPNISDPEFIIKNRKFFFKECVTWSMVSTNDFAARFVPKGAAFDISSPSIFNANSSKYLLGFFNSKVANRLLNVINPTMNYNVGDVESIPFIEDESIKDEVESIVEENIKISKEEWDSFEISWGFKKSPLCDKNKNLISEAYETWRDLCNARITKMQENEIKLNKLFIDLYGVEDSLNPYVDVQNVTLYNAEKKSDILAFISYAVGCIFGRYSLDMDGIVYAGGKWDPGKYKTFMADKDGIIPICDDEYFEDDLTGLFIKFVGTVFGNETLEENLSFIAEALGGKGGSREVIRNYFINGFYTDHLKMYQKRPIYWLFDSGKKNGFKCLIYIHRYQEDTIARIRTDYVHEQQSRYRTAIEEIGNRIGTASSSEKVKLSKQLKKLNEQFDELHGYEEKIHHLADQMIKIDLDDGVKRNYERFSDVLAKLK